MKHKTIPAKKPERLAPGDIIGIVAPAGPFDMKQFEQGITVLKSMGYEVKIPENILQADGFLAGADMHRASLINDFFADSGVKGIICARGGYGSMRILDLVDYEMIRNHPKVFIGFSDISALLLSLYNRCNLVTFHAPVVTSLGKADPRTVQALYDAVAADQPVKITAKDAVVIRPGLSSGVVLGGNLATLCHLLGTPFAPDFGDCILVLEETNEAPYRIDRMLFQMRMAGCFKRVQGILLGTFNHCGDVDEIIKVVERMFQAHDIPILAGFDIGHGDVNLAVPMGIRATLDTDKRVLIFDEAATKS
jgi:muramoyltetrapeptide carboxypeptidase